MIGYQTGLQTLQREGSFGQKLFKLAGLSNEMKKKV